MKRLVLLAAATLLGSGCIVHNDGYDHGGSGSPSGSVVLYWDFTRNAKGGAVGYDTGLVGTTAGACPESAVETITIDPFDASVPAATVNCREWNAQEGDAVQGVIIDYVPSGTQSFRIRGWRTVSNAQVAVYDSTVSINVLTNTTVSAPTAHLDAVTAPIDVFGDLAYGAGPTLYSSCAAAGTPNIGYQIKDGAGTVVADGTVGCSDPLPAPVFTDTLDLDDYTVRLKGYRVSDNTLVFDSCTQSFSHFGTQINENGVAVTLLTQPIPSCQ